MSAGYVERLRRIRFLANVCIVLELDRSLSDTYWLNVNDPGFPFVGVIEHTNFEPSSNVCRQAYRVSVPISAGDRPVLPDAGWRCRPVLARTPAADVPRIGR